jgi:hypothetical protein
VLNRWIDSKPQGKAGLSAHACASPAMPAARIDATENHVGSYGTRVFTGTKGRPEGRGGGAD